MQKVTNDVLWAAQVLLSLKHARFDPKPSSNVENEAINEQEHHQASNLEREPTIRQQEHNQTSDDKHQSQPQKLSSTCCALKPKRSHQQKRSHKHKRPHQRKQPQQRQPVLPPAPPVVERLEEIIMGQPINPIKKKLTMSDVDKHYQRLMLRKEDAILNIESFFNHEEKVLFEQTLRIKVTIYDNEGRGYKMYYKGWNDGKYAIFGNSGWQIFSDDHRLKVGDEVELRIFRHAQTHRLCFICSITSK